MVTDVRKQEYKVEAVWKHNIPTFLPTADSLLLSLSERAG